MRLALLHSPLTFGRAPKQTRKASITSADGPIERRLLVEPGREPAIWFEVEDFLRYFDHFDNPTGLQRVSFEIFTEAARLYRQSGRARFCRLSVYTKKLVPIDFDTVVSAYRNPPGKAAPWTNIWAPAHIGRDVLDTAKTILRHPRFFLRILKTALRDIADIAIPRRRFERHARPGDVIVSLGASWAIPGYMRHIEEAKRKLGIKFSFLLHDLIPIQNESFVEPWHVSKFRDWLGEAIPTADTIFTTTRNLRRDLLKSAGDAKSMLPPIEILQPGAGLSDRHLAGECTTARFPERFVLFVSTIEIRKNHRLLVRVWRQLIERYGADAVPTLVFAGKIGWLVDDLMAELAASDYLGGKIKIMSGLSDADLHQAYRSCLFTVFPSLCEGWGLPVAESLIHGKLCVASNIAPCLETGGNFIDYFDPTDDGEALEQIEKLLLDPARLAAQEARLRAEYRPRAWADCVHTLIGTLGKNVPQTQSAERAAAEIPTAGFIESAGGAFAIAESSAQPL
jgi:glycosyltransferase involved in cell wall biosynthesis